MQDVWPVIKKRSGKKTALVLIVLISFTAFAYSQYDALTGITPTDMTAKVLDQTGHGMAYELQIGFGNPSVMPLLVGYTQFTISSGGENVGEGSFNPFYLPAYGEGTAYGVYTVYDGSGEIAGAVKMSGTISYDLYVTTIDIPFVYYPSNWQQSKFTA